MNRPAEIPPDSSLDTAPGNSLNPTVPGDHSPATRPNLQPTLSRLAVSYSYVNLLMLAVVAINIVHFFNFTAEDAFITFRYAENFVNTGSLVFNQGEPVNAMTSPLHALLSAALYAVTGQTVLANKILALLLVSASALIVWRKFHRCRQLGALALALMVMPPSVLLWTFGGLETPVLLFLVTATVALVERRRQLDIRSLFVVFSLAGLSFLTRYDSVLFFLPLVVYAALKARAVKNVLVAAAPAAVLPLAWLATSVYYYGDLLPTSFYVKTPNGTTGSLLYNGIYITSYLFFIGIIPGLSLVLLLLPSRNQLFGVISAHLKRMWWLYLGIALELLYGLTIATHHMMFSFRFFVPYIPATVILVVGLVQQVSERGNGSLASRRAALLLPGLVLILALFQLYQSNYAYRRSVNGITAIGEYRALGVRDYVPFIQTLEQEARDIEQHWKAQHIEPNRQPRILTYAAGALPYTFRDSYIYEQLVSYRHCYKRVKQGLYADYIHLVAPRHGEVEEQLPLPKEHYTLVSSYEMDFDGSPQLFLVYYNPDPGDHNLGTRIDSACQTAR